MIYITYLTKEKTSLNYEDATEKWLSEANPNSHRVKDLNTYIHNGTSYKVDGKNVVLDYSKKERKVAKWLEETFGGEIYMCPRINNPSGIKTPDYLFKNEKWDLKVPLGKSKRVIDDILKGQKEQAQNFIIDISKTILSKNEILKQINDIYKSKSRKWVNKIIVKNQNDVIRICQKRD